MVFKVLIKDTGTYTDYRDEFLDIENWAEDHCSSYVYMKITDVADVTMEYDAIAEYHFREERDVTLFTLRWSR